MTLLFTPCLTLPKHTQGHFVLKIQGRANCKSNIDAQRDAQKDFYLPPYYLKATFSVRCMTFKNFHIRSNNMKVLVILSYSWSPFLPLTCLYGKKSTFVGLCTSFWSIVLRKNSSQITHANHMSMTTSRHI